MQKEKDSPLSMGLSQIDKEGLIGSPLHHKEQSWGTRSSGLAHKVMTANEEVSP